MEARSSMALPVLLALGACTPVSSYVATTERSHAQRTSQATQAPTLSPEQYAASYGSACARMHAAPKTPLELLVKAPDSAEAQRARPPGVHGSLLISTIRQVISERIDDVRGCYLQALRSHPFASGRITVRFGIAPSGIVESSLVVADEIGIEGLGCCIADTMIGWRFPPPDGGGPVIVTYPFVLRQKDNAR